MSVTMHLYRVVPGVTYLGHYLDGVRDYDDMERIEIMLGAPVTITGSTPIFGDPEYDAYAKWQREQEAECWTDHKNHEHFSWKLLFGSEKRKNVKRMLRRANSLNPTVDERSGEKYLALDEVLYAQGWFFKKRFFRKKFTWNISTTKEEMKHFFDQYIDYSNKRYTDIKETIELFLDSWEDGMIFVCAW